MKRDIKRGDIYMIDLGKLHNGSIQDGYRPCVIISNNLGNKYSPCVIIIPITSKKKTKIPTHVSIGIKDGLSFESTAMCEQQQTINKSNLRNYVCHLSNNKMNEIDLAKEIATASDEKLKILLLK